jgi:hypothetical protein
MFIRKISKFLRGKATSFQIISATVLCGLLGSLPGISQGPLLLVGLLFLLIVLNANLFLGAITLLLVKLVSLLLLPIYYKLGVWLLEGPLHGLVSGLANAPVTAWFGLDYYVMIPSLASGLLLGLAIGVLASKGLSGFRSKMAQLESGSERYQAYTSKAWVTILAWVFVGGLKGKKAWSELDAQRKGLPIRPIGVVLVVALFVLGAVGFKFLDQTIVTTAVRDALEKANGATVDLAAVDIQAAKNRVVVSGLAMADPNQLDTNRFASREILADISGLNLLAKKVVIDSLQIVEPTTGEARRIPGKRIIEVPSVEEEPGTDDVVNIDAYIGQASVWRQRLRTIKRIYDLIAPYVPEKSDEATTEEGLSWREVLQARAEELGYANVKSDTLVSGSPKIWIREFISDELVIGGSEDRFAISGSNLSSQPVLLDTAGKLEIRRQDGQLGVGVTLPFADAPKTSGISLFYRNLSVDQLEASFGRDLPMDGGTMDIVGEGTITGGWIEMPLQVTLRNTTLNAFGTSVKLDELPLQVGVSGTIDKPSLSLPKDALEEAVKSAGKQKIKEVIEEKAGKTLRNLLKLDG